MTTVELTSYLETDLVFSRSETPAFRLEFEGVTAEVVAGWELSAEIHRAHLLPPIAEWTVTVDGTAVTFSLTEAVTAALPDNATYAVRIDTGTSVRYPMGGRLLLRGNDC